MARMYLRAARIAAIGAALTFIPMVFTVGDGHYPQARADSPNAGGKGKGGDNSHTGGNGKSQGNGNDGSDGDASVASNSQGNSDISPSDLGRLNAFLHASPNALKHTAPNSAIGIVAVQYAGALSAYVDAVNLGTLPAPTLDDAAAILAKAANKPLTPEIVAAINQRLAAENPDNPNLAGLADPAKQLTNDQLAQSLSDLANSLQETETSQGLGPIY